MAYLKLYREELRHNFNYLDRLFKKNSIKWGITTKLFCGNRTYLNEVIDLGIKEVHDSRISNLKVIFLKRSIPKQSPSISNRRRRIF